MRKRLSTKEDAIGGTAELVYTTAQDSKKKTSKRRPKKSNRFLASGVNAGKIKNEIQGMFRSLSWDLYYRE